MILPLNVIHIVFRAIRRRFCVMARGIHEQGKQLTSFLGIDVADTFSYRTISEWGYPKVIKLYENLYLFLFSRQLSSTLTITIHLPSKRTRTTSIYNFLLKAFGSLQHLTIIPQCHLWLEIHEKKIQTSPT